MSDSILYFYDELADSYHLIFDDWHHSVAWQGKVLNDFIRSKLVDLNKNHITLLDASCGIGTQSLGLAQHGFDVTGTDLSRKSIDRAKREAEVLGVDIYFGVADFRSLEQEVAGKFDVVLSADNAIPHLLTDDDLELASRNLYSKLNDNGLLVITIRDYDKHVKEKPRATQPYLFDAGKRIVFQVWDWADDGKIYTTNHFILLEADGKWTTNHKKTTYRAILRDELSKILKSVGFNDIEWSMPSESGYYQPVVTARKI